MAADGPRARDILLGYEPLNYHGACWYYVWEAYAAAGASTSMGALPTAYQAWQNSQGKHTDRNPPAGAAIWLGRRYDGNMDGDVFIAGPVDGQHAATDQPLYGQTGLTSIQARMDLCGREYLGWTDHVLDCPITTQGEDDMPLTDADVSKIWNYVIQAQDENGEYINEQYPARGFISNTSANAQAAKKYSKAQPDSRSLTAPAWVAVGLLALVGLVEVVRVVLDAVPG